MGLTDKKTTNDEIYYLTEDDATMITAVSASNATVVELVTSLSSSFASRLDTLENA